MSGTIDLIEMTEEQFLQMDMSEWVTCVDDVRKLGLSVMERLYTHLEEIHTVDDIRYRYFNKVYVGQMMLLESDNEEIESLLNRLRNFVEGILAYYVIVFKEDAFQGEMEMLPPEARAATWLNSMFCRDDADVEGKKADLEMCAKCYPALRNNVERLKELSR